MLISLRRTIITGVGVVLAASGSAMAQGAGIDGYLDQMTRLTFEGKNVPIKPGVVFCLVPRSLSPALRSYNDPQLKSLGCVRTPRQLVGFVVRVFRVGAAYEQEFVAQIQLPLPDNSIQTVWAYTSDLVR